MKYFDYAATTPTSDNALNDYVSVSKKVYGNPGSSIKAMELEQRTRELIKSKLNVLDTHQLIFTSGGTEANNLAILGCIKKRIDKGSHFITSSFEHASVYDVFEKLNQGNSVDYVSSTKAGYVDVIAFKKLLKPTTKFVSIMHVNNELGTEQPIKELYEITKEFNPNIIFMVDSVQGLGKVEMLGFKPDVMTISSHKIYGPKAVGAVIIKKDLKLYNMISGGTKEYGQRAGTQSLPAQVGFATAVCDMVDDLDNILNQVKEVKDYLQEEAVKIEHVFLNANSDSNVVSLFIDVDQSAQVIIKRLYEKGFAISAKSADSNLTYAKSRSLKAIGLSDYRCDRTIRISLSHHKTKEDIDKLLHALSEVIDECSHSKLDINELDSGFVFKLCDELDNKIGDLHITKSDDYLIFEDINIKKEFEHNNYAHLLVQLAFRYLAYNEMDYFITSPIDLVKFFNTLGFIEYGVEKNGSINMIRMYD